MFNQFKIEIYEKQFILTLKNTKTGYSEQFIKKHRIKKQRILCDRVDILNQHIIEILNSCNNIVSIILKLNQIGFI